MIRSEDLNSILGSTLYSQDGDKIGSTGQIYLDDATGRPEWVTVNTGFFGTSESFVPLADATWDGERLTVPYSKDRIKDAPSVDPADGHLSPEEEAELYRYYGISGDTGETGYATTDTVRTGTAGTTGTVGTTGRTETGGPGHDTSGPNTDNAMTRSEEQLRVGKEQVETGRARLRKYVETEEESRTVPVTKERLKVEREPITEGNVGKAMDGPAISEEEHEVVLHEERPVVAKEAVPVERVRLDKETETTQETVSDEVRKERIEGEGVDLRANESRTRR